ncbi:MAG: ATP-dependent Clp protease ATP-binding subunit [Erysipelotrichaceae bacterium]|nr:ATP-dependent Clp protease ATP-binding subunit [Erysipelotrichaceae bacterium]
MKYNEFVVKACPELKEIMHKASILEYILSSDECNIKELNIAQIGSDITKLTPKTRRQYALLLAYLATDNPISAELESYNISLDKVAQLSGLSSEYLLKKPENWNSLIEESTFNTAYSYTFDYDDMVKDIYQIFDLTLNDDYSLVYDIIYELAEGNNNLLVALQDKITASLLKNDYSSDSFSSFYSAPFSLDKVGHFIDGSKYKIDPAINREDEIKEVVLTLLSPEKSVILTGPAGVGKTAIAEQIAYLIANKKFHRRLENKKIFYLDVASITAGCKYVGELEKKVTNIVDELKKDPNIIVFIDEIHTIIGAGRGEGGSMDVSNILKGPISRGEIRIIGATTDEEYNRYFAGKIYDPNLPLKDMNRSFGGDKAFKDRFERVAVKEPDVETMRNIIQHLLKKYSKDYDLPVGFIGMETNALTMFLSTFTSSQYRSSEAPANPRFISHLLGTAFANALYEDHDKLSLSDIAIALYKSDLKFETKEKKYLAKQLINFVLDSKTQEEIYNPKK